MLFIRFVVEMIYIKILKKLVCISKDSNASFKEEHFSDSINFILEKDYLHKNMYIK